MDIYSFDLSINTTGRLKAIDSVEEKVGVSFSLLPHLLDMKNLLV